MFIREINNQEKWDTFISRLSLNTFLHSKAWIEFNHQQGYTSWQFGMYDDENNLVSCALVLKVEAKRGTFLFCPHGPQSLGMESQSVDPAQLGLWRDHLTDLAKTEKCSFIRIQPIVLRNSENQQQFKKFGFRPSPIHMHTELSTVLDISPDRETLLMNMRKTTRQMVKKGEQLIENGEVVIEDFTEITDELYQVYESTFQRGNFVPYSRTYLQREYESFKKYAKVELFGVRYQGKLLSWGMILISGKRAFYHQGANILDKKVPASYLCQWTGITRAKAHGCKTYDFWGVAPQDQPNHPWAKISLFKRGFGGNDVWLLHAQDYVVSWKYWINWIIESYRAKKRGFE